MATSTKKETTVKASSTVGKTANTVTAPKSVGTATGSGVSAAKATAITPTSSATTEKTPYKSDKSNIVNAGYMTDQNALTLQKLMADNGMVFNGSYNDAFYNLKEKSGFLGNNDYNTTIGNATLKAYGYGVNDDGVIYKLEEPETQSTDGRPTRAENNVNEADLYNHYQGVRTDMNNATQELVNSINANKPQIEQTYQDQQKQAYINKVLQDTQMNDYLKAQGISGGMAETTALAAANAYDAQRQAAYQTKQQALTEIEKMVAEAKATGNTNLANAAMQYMSQYQDAMKHLDNLNYQYYNTDLNQFNIDREFAANQAQQQYQNAWNERVYGDQMAQQSYQNQWNEKVYGDTMSQQQWQNQFTQQQYADQMAQQAYQNAWNEKIYGDSQTQQQWENDFALKQLGLKATSGGSSSSSKTGSNSSPSPQAPTQITSYNQLSQNGKDAIANIRAYLLNTKANTNSKIDVVSTRLQKLKDEQTVTEPELEFIMQYLGL